MRFVGESADTSGLWEFINSEQSSSHWASFTNKTEQCSLPKICNSLIPCLLDSSGSDALLEPIIRCLHNMQGRYNVSCGCEYCDFEIRFEFVQILFCPLSLSVCFVLIFFYVFCVQYNARLPADNYLTFDSSANCVERALKLCLYDEALRTIDIENAQRAEKEHICQLSMNKLNYVCTKEPIIHNLIIEKYDGENHISFNMLSDYAQFQMNNAAYYPVSKVKFHALIKLLCRNSLG